MDTQTTNTTGPLPPASDLSTTEVDPKTLPIIDVSSLVTDNPDPAALKQCVDAIHNACRTWGFFYATNHGVSEELQERLVDVTNQFFALPLEEKMQVALNVKENIWRGYFPINAQVTDDKPDLKEGFEMMNEMPLTDPRIQNKMPLFSPNQWPAQLPEFKKVNIEYMEAMKKLGYSLAKGLALSLGLPADYFEKEYLKDPTMILNACNYPPDIQATKDSEPRFGIGEHSDYGLLAILKQDNSGGLQVKSLQHGWTDAKPIDGTFVCNLGDMLQLVTNGLYQSTPHRVRNIYTGKYRLSFPFFFEPSWDAEVKPLPLEHLKGHGDKKVEEEEYKPHFKESIGSFRGKYLDYLLDKMEARYSKA